MNTSSLRQEVTRLKEELAGELSRRQMAEEACQRLISEKGMLSQNLEQVFFITFSTWVIDVAGSILQF